MTKFSKLIYVRGAQKQQERKQQTFKNQLILTCMVRLQNRIPTHKFSPSKL